MPSAAVRLLGRALITSALLVYGTLSLACETDRIDDRFRVTWVYDGDTVRLEDGRKIRLVGINTPETGRGKRPAQPGAEQAAQRLRQIIDDHNGQIAVRYGEDRYDRYDRILAHLFTPEGNSIGATLIREGHAAAITVPPNSWNADCYYTAEDTAREQKLGIWKTDALGPSPSKELGRETRGFHIVHGRVIRVGYSRSATWINLEGNLALRINEADKLYFPETDWDALAGQIVEARGWIYTHKDQLRIKIRHPRTLRILNQTDSTLDDTGTTKHE
jgi:micrococcal nuclease